MKPVFADTSYYLALVNRKDPRHSLAVELAENLLSRVFVTEYVLVELGSALSHGSDRQVYLNLLEDLQSNDSITIIPASESLFRQGVALFANRPDKNWSLVDCTSIIESS
jgi:predicted nucleic acid-binding protein